MSRFLCWLHPQRPISPPMREVDSTPRLGSNGGWGLVGPGTAGDGPCAFITGQPYWRDEALARLAAENGQATALLAAYQRHGEALLDRLAGAFTLVVIDPDRETLFAAVDRMGREALYFARVAGGVAVASHAGPLARHPGVDDTVTPQAIHDYLYFHMVPAPRSVYGGVEKLQAANRLLLSEGRLTAHRYWTPDFREDEVDPQAQHEALRASLRASVGRHVGPETGSFLSGGLDSSTVTGLHAELDPQNAQAFSIGFDQAGYDEMPFARTAARHFGAPLHEYYVTPADVADAIARVAAAYDEPFGNSSALPAYLCARLARDHGITHLLAGDGGDELFAGNARYAKQQVFGLYTRMPATLRRTVLEPLLDSRAGGLPGVRKLRSYSEQARIPLPDRMESYNFLHRIGAEAIFEPEFLREVEPAAPVEHLRQLYGKPAEASALNRMMFVDWQITLADNDLRKVTEMCRLAGVEVAYPMLDDEVVELSCRIPSTQKLPRGKLRHFYKAAFRNFLPDEVLTKRKHGFGLPFGHWLHEDRQLHELARDTLGLVRNRGWVRADFLDRLLNRHLAEHPAYYGQFVWVLMMLGLWLDQSATTADAQKEGAATAPGDRQP